VLRTLLAAALALLVAPAQARAAEIRAVPDLASNPGELLMLERVPERMPAGAPLVVALHGCTQDAEGFGEASGWAGLADRLGFALLLPQQQAANNRDLCFNFFLPGDNRRDRGEAASIRAMVARAVADHRLDPARVFVTGLSAGGAMAAVMLAAYPETFAGGAVVAGVPYGCASAGESAVLAAQRRWFLWTNPYGEAGWAALLCGISRAAVARFPPRSREPAAWRDLVLREAGAPAPAAWPRVSLWQGGADLTVHPANLEELVEQWTAVHGIDAAPGEEEDGAGYRRRAFADATGAVKVEAFELPRLGHAVPVDPGAGPDQCGLAADRHFADVDLCAAVRVARFWGLARREP
jgi:poly(3-hydroxybutyrate) depolymerase